MGEEIEFEVKSYNTSGDKDKITPLSEVEGAAFFTDALEKALLRGEIDIAVHSAKDLPGVIGEGVIIAAVTQSIDPYDVLVVRPGLESLGSLDKLPRGARIGSSSLRRKKAIKRYRPDLKITDIRGDIEERLKKLDEGKYEGLIIAAAGLVRLGLERRISQRIPFEILRPPPLQGSLAIETRGDDKELIGLFNRLDRREKILFVCKENSCRSQIAEALVNHFYWQKFFALSCGSKPSGKVNPKACQVMKERGVDISQQKSKGFEEIKTFPFDLVITLGCGDECAFYPVKKKIIWEIPKPGDKPIEFFRQVREEIENKIRKLWREENAGKYTF